MIKVISDENITEFSRLADSAFSLLSLSGEAEVEVEFYTREEIHALNLETRGVDRATDVLSYPALDKILPFTRENYPFETNEEGRVNIGSIVICEEIAAEQAKEYGHSERRERSYLFTHGLLHLLGYDHMEDSDKKIMREKEEAVLSSLNITRGEK